MTIIFGYPTILGGAETALPEDVGGICNRKEILTLHDIELFGSKIKALLERTAARDLYDVFNMTEVDLFKGEELNLLRKSVIFYMALARMNSEHIPRKR